MARFRTWRLILRASLCALVCTMSLPAQDTYNVFFTSTSVEVEPGTDVTLRIALTNTPQPVTGFSLGVRHDALLLTLDSVKIAADLQDAITDGCGGDSPDGSFFHVMETAAGFTAAMLLRTNICQTGQLAPGENHKLLDLTYKTNAGGRGGATATITSTLGTPAVPVLLDLSGVAQAPTSPGENTKATIRLGGGAPFLRGDANQNGAVDVTDGILVLAFLFGGGLEAGKPTEENCLVVYNFDGSTTQGEETEGDINLSDGVAVLNFLFRSGLPPAKPYPSCGLSDIAASTRMTCGIFNCN